MPVFELGVSLKDIVLGLLALFAAVTMAVSGMRRDKISRLEREAEAERMQAKNIAAQHKAANLRSQQHKREIQHADEKAADDYFPDREL